MGLILGKYEEPAFDILLSRASSKNVTVPYEIRRYGSRFAVEANHGRGGASPFPQLAGYIGVLSRPQNENKESISMTTPVTMRGDGGGTVPNQKMQFMLPAKYDDMSKIPNPTNPNVRVTHLPPAVGAVHRYSGFLDRSRSTTMASKLAGQLRDDGIEMDGDTPSFQYWRYNPPMTLPFLARNEVWIELEQKQVDELVEKYHSTIDETTNTEL